MSSVFPHFNYLTPKTIEDARSLLSRYKGEARVIAGGTDLMVLMKNRDITPAYIIDLEAIPGLNYIRYDGKGLKIGALTTIHDIESSPVVRENFPVLADAARQMGSPQIRNMATVAGNLCRAAPSADMAPPLIGLGAKAKIVGPSGERVIGLEEFFVGPGESVLQSNEILAEIQVPNPPPHTRGIYLKTSARAAVGIAFAGVAVIVTLDAKHTSITDAKIVLGAVAPTPIRATQAEDILNGKTIEENLIEKAARAAAEAAKPISDIRSSAEYRKEMVKVLVTRAIRQVIISI